MDSQFDEARYAEIVGKRADRYLPRFRRFARGEWLSWNWAAFFGTLAWLRYRRLYRWSWLYFLFATPMLVVAALAPVSAGDACQAALNPATEYIEYAFEALIAASWLVPPLFADRLYFSEVRRLAAGDKRPAPGGTGSIVATLAVQALLFVVLMAALPSYSSYRYRARVSEGVSIASAARTAITEYVMEHRRMPERLDEISAALPAHPDVSKVELVERSTIRATFGERAARLAGHTVQLVPTWKDDQIVSWTCRSDDLPNVCLPASCRR